MSDIEYKEKLVAINRITKVVKGGRRLGFAALVVVGNQKGSIGIGQGNQNVLTRLRKQLRLPKEIKSKYLWKMEELIMM